ncbi:MULTISPECIES: type II toxin-antitoxin system RelE/ParE family toxin [Thalassolituus]|uniref:type II toxin-antitoxin system RelE/ParE family toxin n=1 Tax=Thalassolituus TaxID=187492 RepID=UPI00264918A2|nr:MULTISPECIES: type II toxin-antitoxin system RelE/ParE family toxin [Thalassolituus]
MTFALTISPAANNDLSDIYRYSAQQWGQRKARDYLDAIKDTFWRLVEQPHSGVLRPELLDSLLTDTRSLLVESHVIYYQIRANSVQIIRVLHARQDPGRHF